MFCYFVWKYFRGVPYPQKFLNWFNVPRFIDLEWDYARQEHVEYVKFAAFVATMQLLASYSHVKENRETPQAHTEVQADDLLDTDKVVTYSATGYLQISKKMLSPAKWLTSCTVKPCIQKCAVLKLGVHEMCWL